MKKTFSLLLALALVLSFSLVAVTVVAAPGTINVDVNDGACVTGSGQGDPYSVVYCNIQDAVTDAAAGDTINVAAGTYNEAVSIPSGKDGLEIAGTNAIVDGTGLGDVNGFSIASDNVKIHGFTIQNFVVSVQGASTNMKGWGIITVAGTSGGELYDNTITSASGGIYILASTNYEVYDNNINNIAGDFPYHGHGIIVYSSGPAQGAISGNIIGKLGHPNTISDTDVATPGYFGCGQGIYVGSDNVLTLLVDAHGTKVEYNIVSNVKSKALQVSGVTTASTVDVNHNQISGSKLWGLDIMYCGVVNVNNNAFSGMTDFQVVRASYDAANPGNCLTGAEMYDIFKNNGNTFDKAAAAVVPAGNEINTSLANSNYRYIQSDIQDAIDDAHNGYRVEVLAGTYNENVVIDKTLTLIAGSSPVINAGGTPATPNVIGIAIAASNVTVDGFTVINARGSNSGGIYIGGTFVGETRGLRGVIIKNCTVHDSNFGIYPWGTGSGNANVVDHNTVYDIYDDMSGSGGVGIVLWDEGAGAVGNSDNEVTNNTVYNCDRQGIFLGTMVDVPNDNNEISGNIVHDNGLNTGADGHGIQLYYAADNTISNNEIYNHTAATSWFQAGIMLNYSEDNAISCNNIYDNKIGVALYTNTGVNTIHFNNITGNTDKGVGNWDAILVDAENNWWGDASGPTHSSNPGGTGDAVSDNVDYSPWLGEALAPTKGVATSTGTGTASFSPSQGNILDLTAVATPPGAPVLPHGVFSFEVCCIDPGQTVTLTIELPGPMLPLGARWWKYHAGLWYSLPIGSDDGDNTITITLTDGVFPGDADSIPGQITDPGGPGYVVSSPTHYRLDISSTEGGSVTTPGEGRFHYVLRTVVDLVASPDAGYKFVNWTGEVHRIADVNAAETTITIYGNYKITANFETEENPGGEEYTLTISSTAGGSVTSPGEGTSDYEAGTVVNLVASPDFGYEFVNWTGDGITHPDSATTTVTMNGDYSIEANFEFEETTTTGSDEGPSGSLGCFIATAAYGTPIAEQIDVLREFRDVVLLESTVGSQFVALYYQLSPPVADFIAGSSFLRTLVRELLVDPVVWVVEATGNIWRN